MWGTLKKEGEIDVKEMYEKIEQLEKSLMFKSNMTRSIRLNFYKNKLYKIDINPLEEYDVMYKALLGKYEQSKEVYVKTSEYPLFRLYEWRYRETTLRICKSQEIKAYEGMLFS
jgi:hypothetical protein